MRQRSRRGEPRRSPPWCDRRSRRISVRPPCAPGAASASGVPPILGKGRRTTSSRTRPAHRHRSGILPTTATASCSADAIRGAPPPSPEPAAAPPLQPMAADTTTSPAARRPARRATANPIPPGGPAPCSRVPLPGSAEGFALPPAATVRDPIAVAAPHVSSASTISRPASRSPCSSAKDRHCLRLKTVSGRPGRRPSQHDHDHRNR